MKFNIDKISKEWAYRTNTGMPSVTRYEDIEKLQEVLIDLKYPGDFIFEYIGGLLIEKDKSDDERLADKDVVYRSEDGKTRTIKYSSALTYDTDHPARVAAEKMRSGDSTQDKEDASPSKLSGDDFKTAADKEKEDSGDGRSEIIPPKQNTEKVVNQFSDEVEKIIKGELKAKGTGGSMVGEMYGGIALKGVLANPDMTEDEFIQSKVDEVKKSPISKGMNEKKINAWLRIAYRTGKSEVKSLNNDPAYKYKKEQPEPYPIPLMDPVATGGSTRKKVESILSDGLKNAKTPEEKVHYEKQLKLIEEKADTDTGVLYINKDGNVTMKHTSNKSGWNDPHANTGVGARNKLMAKSTERLSKESGLSDNLSKQISDNLTKTSEEAASDIANASKMVSKDVSNGIDDSQQFAKQSNAGKLFSNFDAGQTGRKNYINDFKSDMSSNKGLGKKINTKLEEINIDPKKASDDQIAGAILELSKTDSATSVRKFVNKLSDSVAQAREVYESEKRKNPNASDSELKDLTVKRLNNLKPNTDDPGTPFDRDMVDSLMSDELSFLKDTAKKERDIMGYAHNKIVTDINRADEQFKKDNPDLADKYTGNGPHAQAYVDTFMKQMHFDKNILGENDGVGSMNIAGYDVSPKMIRDSIKELTGFEGDIETPAGKNSLMKHLRKNLKIDPQSKSVSIQVGGKDIEIGQDQYRTKGVGVNSVMGLLGKDMQNLLKKKATGN